MGRMAGDFEDFWQNVYPLRHFGWPCEVCSLTYPVRWTSPANPGVPEEAGNGTKALLLPYRHSSVQPARLGGRKKEVSFKCWEMFFQGRGIKTAGGAITPPANNLQFFFPVAASIENSADFHGVANYDIENCIIFYGDLIIRVFSFMG